MALNRSVARMLGRATAPQNAEGEQVGVVNRMYARLSRFGAAANDRLRRLRRGHRRWYRALKVSLAVLALLLVAYWIWPEWPRA